MKKRGITPIISVILMLMLTLSLAGIAFSYTRGMLSSTLARNINVIDATCKNGRMSLILKNIGTDDINVAKDLTVLLNGEVVKSSRIKWSDKNIRAGGSIVTLKIKNCKDGSNTFKIIAGTGSIADGIAYCI